LDKEKYYLWGAGTYGRRTVDFFNNDLTFEAVIDSNPEQEGKLFCGLNVISPAEVLKSNSMKKIVISQNVPTAVRAILNDQGLTENNDFYTLHDFIPRFFWDKDKSLVIKSVDIAITTMCNKRCESCQTYIPFAKNRRHFSVDDVISDLDLLYSYVSRVMNINICCGESLMNPELPDICLEIYKKYGNNYQTLSLQTNATILPTDADMRKFADAKITLVTSNYPEQAEMTAKLIELCKQYNIPWLINSSGNRLQWYDLGDPRMINSSDEQVLRKRYMNCWKPGMGLNNGQLYICGAQLWTHLVAEVGEIKSGDCFDLRQPITEESKKDLSKILFREPPECGYISHCKRCLSVMNPVIKK
jgi:hypothetical protein